MDNELFAQQVSIEIERGIKAAQAARVQCFVPSYFEIKKLGTSQIFPVPFGIDNPIDVQYIPQ